MHYCLFPKFYQKLSLEEMMDRCVECGLDAPCIFVRDGYWVTWENIRTQTAAYMAAAESRGMKPEFASIDGEAEMLWEHPEILGSLADAGIRAVRTGLCQVPASLPITGLFRLLSTESGDHGGCGAASGNSCTFPNSSPCLVHLADERDYRIRHGARPGSRIHRHYGRWRQHGYGRSGRLRISMRSAA